MIRLYVGRTYRKFGRTQNPRTTITADYMGPDQSGPGPGGLGSYLPTCSRMRRMMLSSSMSAMTRISAPHREQVNGSLGCKNQFLLRSQRSQVRILSGAPIKSIWRNPVRRKSGLEEPAEVAASAVESADIPVAATVLGRVPAKIGCVGAARRGAEFDCGGDHREQDQGGIGMRQHQVQ